jgi:YbbR domain-containing protein
VSLRERLVDLLIENWNLKLVSFAFAIVLYSMVHGGKDAKRSIIVELEALLPPEGSNRVLVTSLPKTVRLEVKGTNQAIDELRSGAVAMQLDLTSGRDAHVVFDTKMVKGPQGLQFEVEQFDPPSIDLAWEERIKRDVPVQVSVVGTPAAGFVVKGSPMSDPPKVSVTGPMGEVAVLQKVRAESFDVTGLSDGQYPRQLALERLPASLKVEPRNVIVTTEITREIAERPFTKLAVVVVGLPKAKTLPAEVDVRLTCPPEILRGLRPEQIVPRVEITSKETTGSESHPVLVGVERCEAHVVPPSVVVRW